MIVAEQEKLFKQVRDKFPGMSIRWCSGYVAGILGAGRDESPDVDDDSEYENGYCAGYLDESGADVLEKYPDVFGPRGLSTDDLDFRWWE